MKIPRGIGKKVREHRLRAGLTQRQAVAFLGLRDATTLSQIETGTKRVNPKMRALLKAFVATPPEAIRIRAANLGIKGK